MMFRLRRPKRPVVHSRHGWPNRSWHIPALMGVVCLLLAASLALGVMELGTGGSAASVQEAASVESAQGEEESETEESETQAEATPAAQAAISAAADSDVTVVFAGVSDVETLGLEDMEHVAALLAAFVQGLGEEAPEA